MQARYLEVSGLKCSFQGQASGAKTANTENTVRVGEEADEPQEDEKVSPGL